MRAFGREHTSHTTAACLTPIFWPIHPSLPWTYSFCSGVTNWLSAARTSGQITIRLVIPSTDPASSLPHGDLAPFGGSSPIPFQEHKYGMLAMILWMSSFAVWDAVVPRF